MLDVLTVEFQKTDSTTWMEGNPNMNSLYVKGIVKKIYISTAFSLNKSKSILFADSLKIIVKRLLAMTDYLSAKSCDSLKN